MHNYKYQVFCENNGVRTHYRGSMTAHSESEVVAYIKRQYINVVDWDVWEV